MKCCVLNIAPVVRQAAIGYALWKCGQAMDLKGFWHRNMAVFSSDTKDVPLMCSPHAEIGPHLGPKALNVHNSVELPVSVSVW